MVIRTHGGITASHNDISVSAPCTLHSSADRGSDRQRERRRGVGPVLRSGGADDPKVKGPALSGGRATPGRYPASGE